MKLTLHEKSVLLEKLKPLFPDVELWDKLAEVDSNSYKYLLAMYYRKEIDIIKQVLKI